MTRREHWENIYRTKAASDVSWYQPVARVSLDLIQRAAKGLDSPIIDVGGGASTLVDGLLDLGYSNVTVLDLAGESLAIARQRLGKRAESVKWIASDILTASFRRQEFEVWHDRAVFHFLTDPVDRAGYVAKVLQAVETGGHVVVSGFALDGPARCSGLEVVRYSAETMQAEFGEAFALLDTVREEHHTPSGAVQKFLYCLFRLEA